MASNYAEARKQKNKTLQPMMIIISRQKKKKSKKIIIALKLNLIKMTAKNTNNPRHSVGSPNRTQK